MQPYQEASEEHTKQSVRPFEAVGTAAGLGLKGAIGSRVMSMLNKYVPASLAVKGLSKIDPRLGKFLSLGQEAGHSMEDLSKFISDKIEPSESKEPAKQDRNIIEQYDPDLHTYIDTKIRNGIHPLQAGAKALAHGRFKKAISKLTKDHKTSWDAILTSVYGSGEKAQPNQQQQTNQSAQGGQSGPGQQALMDILAKINQKLGQ